jgi:transcriptional regulator
MTSSKGTIRRYENRGKYDAAIMALVPREGVEVDQYELAKMVGCTRQYISMIEMNALRKLRLVHGE